MPPFLGSASGVRGTDETAAATGSFAATWTHLLLVLIIVGVVIGGGLNLFGFGVSSSAPPRSLCGPVPAARVHWPIKGCWSRPLLADHAELAALEQAQLQAARARRGWRPISRALSSHFDKRTHRRRPADASRASDWGFPMLLLPAWSHPEQLAYIFAVSKSGKQICWPCCLWQGQQRHNEHPPKPTFDVYSPKSSERVRARALSL